MCPMCHTDHPPTELGSLGRRVWVRCRLCGWTFELSADELEADLHA